MEKVNSYKVVKEKNWSELLEKAASKLTTLDYVRLVNKFNNAQIGEMFDVFVYEYEAVYGTQQTVLTKSKLDLINHPPHYTQSAIEPITVIEAWKLGFNLGNTVKYISRAEHKGTKLQDLEKARWYLDREIANLKKENI